MRPELAAPSGFGQCGPDHRRPDTAPTGLRVHDKFRHSGIPVMQIAEEESARLLKMEEALRGLQVQPVETVGAQFDPRVHEALGSIETKEHPDHQVLEEIRRGYKLRDKLLRPALVRIASNPAQVNE